MKISNLFILRSIAGEHLLIPTGSAALDVSGLISLTESGALLYQKMVAGCDSEELLQCLLSEYEIDADTARADIAEFLDQMRTLGILIED